jgi:glycerophosphoryl diester phosphodiesterase
MMQITRQQFVAHRGYQKYYPENTLLAVRKAIAAGALFIEIDVQLSRDQVPMVYHDDTLDRVSARSGKVSELTARELGACPAHEPQRFGERFLQEKIATLAELVTVIQAHPALTFYIELKEEAVRDHGDSVCLTKIAAVLQPVIAQCVLISFDLDALVNAQRRGFARIGPVLRDWATRQQQIDRLQAAVMFINKHRIPAPDLISASCPIVVYEVDDGAEAQQLLQRGAAKVETFAIGDMIDGN